MIVLPAHEQFSPVFALSLNERAALIRECRRVLTIQQRLIVTWHFHDELPLTEIAARFNVSIQAVSKRLNKTILPRMKAELERRGIARLKDLL